MNICIFGDSITWGAYLSSRSSWANLLRNNLERVVDDNVAVYDLGIDGNTSRDLLARIDVEAKSRNPGLIIIAIGTNDSCFLGSKDKPLVDQLEFGENLQELIRKSREYTDRLILVGLGKGDDTVTNPLPRSTTGKCYDKENIAKYDSIIEEVAKGNRLVFVKIIDLLSDEDFDDGLHPNIQGHVKIFEAVRTRIDL